VAREQGESWKGYAGRLEAENAALRERVATLEAQVKSLLKRVDELTRAGKRQASPFSKGDPKKRPKRPGRKKGKKHGGRASRPKPPKVDETIDVPLPNRCPYPECQGDVERVRLVEQLQTDLPPVRPIVREFRIEIGRCTCCGKRVQPRHPLQASDALGAASSTLGANVLGLGTLLNKEYGLGWKKVATLIETAFGLKASPSTYCRAALRVGDRIEPTADAIVDSLRESPVVSPDETGWRTGGHKRWLWAFTTPVLTVYAIAASRGFDVAASVLGEGFDGALVRDGWAPYRSFDEAVHQTCLGHLLRRCRSILDSAQRGAARFAHGVRRVLKGAIELRDRADELTEHGFASLRGKLEAQFDRLLSWNPTYEPNARLAKHLRNEREAVFTFLYVEGVEPTNWEAEQAIRPAVLARKLSGGSRTDRGATVHARLLTVLRSAKQQGRDPFALLVEAFHSPGPIDLGLVPDPGG
jgi:transposase